MAKRKVPVSGVLFGLVGIAALTRAFWRPYRALTKQAALEACAGPSGFGICRQTVKLRPSPGAKVLAAGGGRVASVGPNWVHLNLASEGVVTGYYGIRPDVSVGDYVWPGGKVGTAEASFEFGVDQITPKTTSAGHGYVLSPLEPSAWLASRGYKLAQKLTEGSTEWCATGRKVNVPADVHGPPCGLQNPATPPFALMPVSVTQQ